MSLKICIGLTPQPRPVKNYCAPNIGQSGTQRNREDAGTIVSDQQMRYAQTLYPVDRYLVESSKQIDMINIIEDDNWMSEPALRPEDEIILRKLHDMLQSTADDLKLLSGELSKYHEPGVQKKSFPTPLDDEFNEKVHIEEIVNAKFHGHKVIDNMQLTPKIIQKDIVDGVVQSIVSKTKNNVNTTRQHITSVKKTPNKKILNISKTKVLQIHENRPTNKNNTSEKNIENSKNHQSSCIAYNEIFHIYEKPKPEIHTIHRKSLQIQEMPRINIRSQLQEQKVLQLDIIPEPKELQKCESDRSNALVIEVKHEPASQNKSKPVTFDSIQLHSKIYNDKPTVRKVSKMSVYESSESTNNASSECQRKMTRKKFKELSIQQPARSRHDVSRVPKKRVVTKKDIRYTKPNLEEWKNKLSGIYGTTSRTSEQKFKKISPKKSYSKKTVSEHKLNKDLNNIEYIPYTKLTLGGVNVSDIEKEISNIPNRQDIVLSPFLDKILSSRESSFHQHSPVKNQNKRSKVLTTSDENLLQEVLDIEKQVIQTMSVINLNENTTLNKGEIVESNSSKASNSYVDDFEDDKSNEHASDDEDLSKSESMKSVSSSSSHKDKNILSGNKSILGNDNINTSNKTFTKVTNLSFKNKVDIFEFVPPNDTQDTGTQSTISSYIKPQETQTSPQNGNSNIQSIRNDLWPSIDPKGEVEEMFKLEKDFIKNLIIKEYGDLIEENLKKPSTSKNTETERNVTAFQKNTQTSPAHVKSIMTSPKRTKTRTTSPFAVSVSVHQQTSPFAVVANDEELKSEMEKDQDFDLSVNLSSPRFSLRLPQTSRNVLSNVDAASVGKFTEKNLRKYKSSSSSVDGDYSSSDISSIGEINNKYKRRLTKVRIPSLTELSSSSSLSRYSTDPSGFILPLKSEGEASLSQINRKKNNKVNKSEGEISLGQWS